MEATWRWAAVTAAAPVSWGATYWVTGHALPVGNPLWGGVLRALPAGLVLLALPARSRGGRLLYGDWWWRAAVLGTLVNGAFFCLVYASAQLLPSSIAATVTGVGPLVVLALAWPLLGERPRARPVLAALAGLAGVALLVAAAPAAADPVGVVAALTAVLAFCLGTVLSQRWSRRARERDLGSAPAHGGGVPAPFTMTAWQLVLSGLLLAPVAAAVEGLPPSFDARGLGALVFVSLVATALAFTCWFAGLAHLPAGAVALVGLLNPVTGVTLGTVLAGERLAVVQVVGLALVLGGVALGQFGARTLGARTPGCGPRTSGPAPLTASGSPPRAPTTPSSTHRRCPSRCSSPCP